MTLDRSSIARHVSFLLLAGMVLTILAGLVSPPIALAAGLALALTLGNPLPELSRKGAKLLLQWSVVGAAARYGEEALHLATTVKLARALTLFLIGAGLSRHALKTVGFRPMLQGVLLWALVSVAGLAAVRSFMR